MAQIQIIAVPPGQAPLWVREEWVGLVLPVEDPPTDGNIQIGARGGRPENIGGYYVRTTAALEALGRKSPDAAEWWESNQLARVSPWLVFKREVCQLLP